MLFCMKHRIGRSTMTATFGLPPWKYNVLDQHPFGMERRTLEFFIQEYANIQLILPTEAQLTFHI